MLGEGRKAFSRSHVQSNTLSVSTTTLKSWEVNKSNTHIMPNDDVATGSLFIMVDKWHDTFK